MLYPVKKDLSCQENYRISFCMFHRKQDFFVLNEKRPPVSNVDFFFVLEKKAFTKSVNASIVQTGNEIYLYPMKKDPQYQENYLYAIILNIAGTTSPFNKLNDGNTPVWFNWASTFVLLRSLFNSIICCWHSENIRSAFLESFFFFM